MGVYDEFKLDKNIDRNSFTKEHAAAVFQKAAEAVQSGKANAEMVEKLVSAGFDILKLVILFA